MFYPELTSPPLLLAKPTLGHVHVWLFSLVNSEILSPDETARANRFVNPQAREAFLKGRSGLREACSRYLGIDGRQVDVGISNDGKPYLQNDEHLHFNLSHCGGRVVAAFSSEEIGIDLESPARCEDFHGIARRFFTGSESAEIEAAGESGRDVFFRMWTAKEAMLKLSGTGIAVGLESAVTNDPRGAVLDGKPVYLSSFGLDEMVGAIASFSPFEVNVWFDL